MKTPSFWKTRSTTTALLTPLSWVYEAVYLIRRALSKQIKLSVPVVCIGNVTAGGSGKTPVALSIGATLKERGVNAFFVSRGYGGDLDGPVLVNLEKHRAYEVGDEPMLLAEVLPTVVGKDRIKAAELAIVSGAKLLIFDDGFQNKKFFKDFSFLVIDGMVGFGNGLLLPAGPLRERPHFAFKRTHCIVMINPGPNSPPLPKDRPVLGARTRVTGLAEKLEGQKIVGFCGIAFPEKFQLTLTQLGARLIHFRSFADHEPYRYETLLPLAEIGAKEKAFLVTTRKDYVRLPRAYREKVIVVDIELQFDDQPLLKAQLDHIAGLV